MRPVLTDTAISGIETVAARSNGRGLVIASFNGSRRQDLCLGFDDPDFGDRVAEAINRAAADHRWSAARRAVERNAAHGAEPQAAGRFRWIRS